MQAEHNPLDQVILVNEQDEQIGVMDKMEAHRGRAQLHRAISVFLKNDQGDILLQQRSAEKIVGAGQWANTCCGNVRPGESYEQCAVRRLEEELGITGVKLTAVHKFTYFVQCNNEFSEREIDQVFIGSFNDQPSPNPAEVQMTVWKSVAEIISALKSDTELPSTERKYAPWFHILMAEAAQQGFLS